MKNCLRIVLAIMPLVFATSALGQTWSLSGDWDGVSNPNGPWNYGYFQGNTFTSFGTGNGTSYGSGYLAIEKFPSGPEYGIEPGEVSLEADGGTPDVRFIAPVTGTYTLDLAIGGASFVGGVGGGNADASKSGLLINNSSIPDTNVSDNVYSWNLTESLNAGDMVDAYVGAGLGDGNTQTVFSINVPEPGYLGLLAVGVMAAMANRSRWAKTR